MAIKTAVAKLESLSPYSQSQRMPEKPTKTSWDEWEEKHWKSRCHVNSDGHIFIPPMAFKRSVETAARYLRMRIPGKDRSEFGKHFVSGVLVTEGMILPETLDTVQREKLDLSPRGKRGERGIIKSMPVVYEWSGDVTYYIVDETITEEVFEKHLTEAGNFIGIGRFRPENGGIYGRYKVAKIDWIEK